jgi:long-subunit acyl-CoA synthetase (AMP-forming)
MLKHSTIVAAVGSMMDYVTEFATPTSEAFQETYLAYLPAAHILEFAVRGVVR